MLIRRAALAAALIGAITLSLGGCTSSGDTFIPPTHSATPQSTAAHRSGSPGSSAHASRAAAAAAAAARRHRKLCAGLVDAGTKFVAAERAYSTNSAKQNQVAVQAIARQLQSVEGLAPRRLKSPIHDMIAAFHTFAAALTHPTAQSQAQASALAQRLTADGKAISGYVTAHCPAS